MLKTLCLLSVLACSARAYIVCPPNACQTVRCAAVMEEDCNGVVDPNGGFCGCCPVCKTMLGMGEKCVDTSFLLGVPSTSSCGTGLYCDAATSTCKTLPTRGKRYLGPCEAEVSRIETDIQMAGHTLLGLEKPKCDRDGSYLGMQVKGSQAYCVAKDGTPIDSYSVNRWETGPDMNCQCARDLYNYMQSGLIGKLFYCEANGNYPPTPSTTATPVKRYLGPCEAEVSRIETDIQMAGHPLLGLEKPKCDRDGSYLGMQVKGSQAYCVAKDGTPIDSYSVNRWEAGPDMNCQCARDLYNYMQSGLIGKMFYCEANGNYPPTPSTTFTPVQ